MTRIEGELHDLYECLMRNDDMADRDTYHTIVGIANDVAKVEAENEKLRAENAKMQRELDFYKSQVEGVDEDNRRLRKRWQDAMSENAKLMDAIKKFVEDTHCEDCPCRRDCDDNNRIFCVNDFSYHAFAAMRELGIENAYD